MSKRYEDIYTQNYYDQYSVGNGHEGYEDSKYTKDFLKNIAGRIYEDRKPESVLDVGCAMGYLVEALRDLGVEAYGVDVSEYAISKVREDLKPFCKAASALEELPEGLATQDDLEGLMSQMGEAMLFILPKPITITLPASGWSNNQQTVTATGVTADNAVTPSPAPASWEAAGAAGVRCTAQGADSLTFTCSETPTEDLTYNVLIQEVMPG